MRLAALKYMGMSKATIHTVVGRTRDVKEPVRVQAYKALSMYNPDWLEHSQIISGVCE